MWKIIKDNYLFLFLFLILLLKEPIYNILTIKDNIYTPLRCNLEENAYNKLLEFSKIDYIYESDYLNTLIIYKDIYNIKINVAPCIFGCMPFIYNWCL